MVRSLLLRATHHRWRALRVAGTQAPRRAAGDETIAIYARIYTRKPRRKSAFERLSRTSETKQLRSMREYITENQEETVRLNASPEPRKCVYQDALRCLGRRIELF